MTIDQAVSGARTVRVRTTSPAATRSLGAALAAVAQPGDRIALLGPLGAGKTQLAKGFGAGLGVTDPVTSPSFTLMAEYVGRLRMFHLDLYRLTGSEDVIAGGLLDEREDEGVTLVEWADRIDAELDSDRLVIRIALDGDESRTLTLETADGARYAGYVDATARWARDAGRDIDGTV